MNQYLYLLLPYFSLGMVALSFQFRLHKRSVSTFMAFVMIAFTSNAIHYGYVELGLIAVIVYMVAVMVRAIAKPANDTIIPKIYRGCEKRNKRNKYAL